jgi:hypothetical protein
MIYRIYDPATITTSYFDEYGEEHEPTSDAVDQPFTEEQALDGVRAVRNDKLVASDWTQLPDVSLSPEQVEAWRVYRQQLRDITDGLQWDVTTWPPQP